MKSIFRYAFFLFLIIIMNYQVTAQNIHTYTSTLKLVEHHSYGSDRLSIDTAKMAEVQHSFDAYVDVQTGEFVNYISDDAIPIGNETSPFVLNKQHKNYELSNHLGNILATVNDRKIGEDTDADNIVNSYWASVSSSNDYYPFGMTMHGRSIDGKYRMGFQGQERDDEVKGDKNSVNFKYRMHDPRMGRFFAEDPLAFKYPYMTTYQFAGNKPVWSREIEGLEGEVDAQFGVTFNIGNRGNTNAKLFFGLSFTDYEAYNTQTNLGIGLSLYTGGLGTNQGTTGKSSFNLDLNYSLGFTVGSGNGETMQINNYYQGSGISTQNSFKNSGSFGVVGTLSSNYISQPGRNQLSGYLGSRINNFSLSTYNDLFTGPLNKDSYWTGGFDANLRLNSNTNFAAKYDGFTAYRPLKNEKGEYPSYPIGKHFYYGEKGSFENGFNNGQTILKLSNPNFSVGIGHIGNGIINGQWLQNLIHDNWPKNPINRFENTSKESLIFQFGVSSSSSNL